MGGPESGRPKSGRGGGSVEPGATGGGGATSQAPASAEKDAQKTKKRKSELGSPSGASGSGGNDPSQGVQSVRVPRFPANDPRLGEEEGPRSKQQPQVGDSDGTSEAFLVDDDPVELLEAQGVSSEVAREMLDRADGDVDKAVMLIIARREMEQEQKDMAAVMEESLREAEAEAAKRDAEASDRKRTATAQYFQGSSFLKHLGEETTAVLMAADAREDVIALLDFERQCKKWYRGCAREVDSKFAAIAGQLVASLDPGSGEGGGGGGRGGDPGGRRLDAADKGRASGGGKGSVDLLHSMLVAHLIDLKEAVLSMPQGIGGGVPEIFSPSKDAEPERVDLTIDLT